MGNISIGIDLFRMPIMYMISKAGDERAGHALLRESIFIRLLVFSSDGCRFQDAKQFAKVLGVPVNQAKLVWDVCVSEKILINETGSSYSAIKWMTKNQILPSSKTSGTGSVKSDKQDAEEQICVSTNENPEKGISEKEIAEPVCQQQSHVRQIKEQVRPNVRLSRQEIEALKKSYSDEEISRMLDKLSEYKTNTGKSYSSDYQAIIRWVCRSIHERSNPVSNITSEFPSWLYGETA